MAGFIRRKKVRGYTYYYYVEKARVDGKPVDAVHVYLGSAEEILRKATGVGPESSSLSLKSFEYGKIASILAVDEELGFRQIVNDIVPKRDEKGLTVGDYMLIAVFGRWCGPLSKAATARHFTESFLGFALKLPHKVNAENIISHMERLDEEAIRAIETELGRRLGKMGITPDMIVWDTTNNYTFIDHGESIPKKGMSKQGRRNKNLIGLGLAVSGQDIPVFHKTVPGNTHDAPLFSTVVDEIIERLEELHVAAEDVVLVFDKGNNSEDNIDNVLGRMHVVGSLKKNQVGDLFKRPLEEFEYLYTTTNDSDVLGFSTRWEVFGRDFPLVVTYNPRTHKRQERTYQRSKKKIMAGLKDIKSSVERKGRGRKTTLEGAVKKASKLVPEQYSTVFRYKAFHKDNARVFNFWVDEDVEEEMMTTFGKMAIFTDMEDWPPEKVAQTYNRKAFIEQDFHWLKDKLLIPITPIWHRKDGNIRVHVFLCILGLFFVRYLSWKVGDQGITDERMMDELARIRVALVSRSDLKKPELVIEELTPLQARLFTKLDLSRYIKLNNF